MLISKDVLAGGEVSCCGAYFSHLQSLRLWFELLWDGVHMEIVAILDLEVSLFGTFQGKSFPTCSYLSHA